MSAGKGDRPRNVDKKKYDENFDKIFGKKSIVCDGATDVTKKCLCCGELLFTVKEIESGFCTKCYIDR